MRQSEIIDICVDCLFCLAYGSDHEGVPPGQGALIGDQWGATDLTLGCPADCCPDETDPWFSWSPCQGCGSPLGGDREHATVLRED